MKLKQDSQHKTINYQDLKYFNLEALLDDLWHSPWDSAFIFDEIDYICDTHDLMAVFILDDVFNV